MQHIAPNKKQKALLAELYRQYLSEHPEPTDSLRNKYNLFDDINSTDAVLMDAVQLYLLRSNGAGKSHSKSVETIKETIMPKDRGRKAIKKPKQVKVKPVARYG